MALYDGSHCMAVFSSRDQVLEAIRYLKAQGHRKFIVYAPVPDHEIEHVIERPKSPVRIFSLVGAITGFCTGWALTIGSVTHYPLIVGGKPLVSVPPFGVIAYILTILFGALATMAGFLINARLPQPFLAKTYDERLSSDHYGVQCFAPGNELKKLDKIMKKLGAVRVVTGE